MKDKFKFLLLFLLWTGAVQAIEKPPAFKDLMRNITSLQVDFLQKNYQPSNHVKHTKGQLFFQPPNQLKWHQTQPDEQIILISKGQTWIYDVGLEQIVKRKSQLDQTPLSWLLSSNQTNKPIFLTHKKGINWYQHIDTNENILQFGFKDKKLVSLIFTDILKNQTQVDFSNHQKIIGKPFELVVPDYVDVIDYTN